MANFSADQDKYLGVPADQDKHQGVPAIVKILVN